MLSISLGSVSAIDKDTNATVTSIDDDSQIDEINFDNKEIINDDFSSDENEDTATESKEIEDKLTVSEEVEDDLGAGDVSLIVVNQKSSYSTSESVTVKMGTYSMASSSDSVNVYLNNKNIGKTTYGIITGSGYAVPLSTAITGSNSIYCSFQASGIWSLTSDTVNVMVSGGGSGNSSTTNPSASISIYDMNYPSNSTITSNGDYTASIAYNIVKSGDGFSDESLELFVNGQSQGSVEPNSYNRLGNIKIFEDNEWLVTIVYTATANGRTVSATSNELKFITKNTSGVDPTNSSTNGTGGNSSIDDASAIISIYDMNYPSNSTITSDGDYVVNIAYNIVKSGDGFSDESLEVFVNGVSVGTTTPNASNRLGSLTIYEDDEWMVTIVYTATIGGKKVTATSNALKFITKNTSGVDPTNSSTNGTGGNTNGSDTNNTNPQPGNEIQIIIRDANHPDDSNITLTDKYNALIQYYVTIPSGSLLTNEIIIMCNNQALATIENLADRTFTSIGGTILLNESGDYVFTAIYKYYSMSIGADDVNSNSITYHVVLSNQTETVTPTLSISIADVTYPNQATAIVESNVDGAYVINVGGNNYDVVVNGGIGSVAFSLPANTYTAIVYSKNNASLRNSTTFTVNPKVKTTPTISSTHVINGNKVSITVNLGVNINAKITVTLNGNNKKEVMLSNGVATVEFDNLNEGDYSYSVVFDGNDDYNRAYDVKTFTITSQTPINGSGNNNGTESGNGSSTNPVTNGTDSGNGSSTNPTTNGTGGNNNPSSYTGPTIVANDLTRGYNSPYDFKATFYDKNGNILANSEVNVIINGNDNFMMTDEYGVAKIVKKLSVGKYELEIRNLATGDVLYKNSTIVSRITGNKNIKVDYSYSKVYKIRLFADNGNPVGKGESVLITLNKVKRYLVSDNKGYVSFKVSGLLPKTYTITALYKGVKVSNKVVVKQILKSKNVKVKKSKKTKKFSATLKTSAGKAIKGKKITFKIKGKKYTAKTNKKGVATIKIAKNLKN